MAKNKVLGGEDMVKMVMTKEDLEKMFGAKMKIKTVMVRDTSGNVIDFQELIIEADMTSFMPPPLPPKRA